MPRSEQTPLAPKGVTRPPSPSPPPPSPPHAWRVLRLYSDQVRGFRTTRLDDGRRKRAALTGGTRPFAEERA